ncbi:uncharacterized protein V1510DRAFT_393138 [Dipodascopsis tothii]|uniref:uncharacterized protein n=1 Tax=Dipodascopsis tothii TaxID=44089 RepID=UPI0034CD499F
MAQDEGPFADDMTDTVNVFADETDKSAAHDIKALGATDSELSQKSGRLRWATQRYPNGRPHRRKRFSRPGSGSARMSGLFSGRASMPPSGDPNDPSTADTDPHRRVYVNLSLPETELDDEGKPLARYPRNKTRSAKYTPLSFVPKNLYYQFHNVANIYFLFIVILSIFPIFGSTDPGLNAVPIIVIVVITAFKDAIEDYRRTVLDMALNNTPTQLLAQWTNPNVSDEDVSLWRRIKKASTRLSLRFLRWFKRSVSKKARAKYLAERAAAGRRGDEDTSLDLARVGTTATGYSEYDTRSARNSESYQMRELSPSRDYAHPAPINEEDEDSSLPAYRPSIDLKNGSLMDFSRDVPNTARFKRNFWKNVRVGDIVRIRNDDEIPADVVILSTSDSDGACYVETKNLDGETNLKVRQALRCGAGIKHSRDCERAAFIIDSEAPHPNLYSYSGVVRWTQNMPADPSDASSPLQPQEMAEPITINNMLLRGCSLRNTDWVIGVVLFTGAETKIMLNAGETPSKRSRIARELNINVVINFVNLFVLCFISGVVEGVFWSHRSSSWNYFEFGSVGGSAAVDGLVTFWTGVILFQTLVPISLYITIEIIKTAQAFFIYSDTYMYYEPIDYPCTPKSWNISDDLGQIEYIFSDKTGTLTQNVMQLKKCTVNGVSYGEAYTEAMAGIQKREGLDAEKLGAQARERIARAHADMIVSLKDIYDNPYLRPENATLVAPTYVDDMKGASGSEQAAATRNFMLALALCHSVLTEKVSEDPPVIDFKAQSPDEAALVGTARDMGFSLVDRTQRGVVLDVQGLVQEYPVLTTLEFNSTRKRMSAIVRMPEDGRIVLFCKGADSMIYSRLNRAGQEQLKKQTLEHLGDYATEGLRTLCIAQRVLTEEEYALWSKDHDEAAAALVDREEKMEIAADRIERELVLLGGTAIEDRLQDGVPDAISLLAEAGIKLWVLTGDKVETAINIGFSCNILSTAMELIVFQLGETATLEQAEAMLVDYMGRYFGLKGTEDELKFAKTDHTPPPPTHALVIDGDALKLMLDGALKTRFLLLCKQCKAVLCCRVSPAQKAAVVKMVKDGLDVMTLAIGDGANDVAMIQAADIGVGIAGEEGRQAVMSSDYAVGQFRFLSRLLLVHGRWSYRRLSEMIANFFYKNLIFTLSLFWYQIYNNFDASYLFDYTYILLYNLAFTSLPVILMGIMDQDVDDRVSLAVPELFRRGILRKEWTQRKFWLYMLDGVYQSVICFFFAYLCFYQGGYVTESGLQINQREFFGMFVATSAIIVCNLYVMLNQYRWDWVFMLIIAFSIVILFFWTGVYSVTLYSASFYGAAGQVYGTLLFWLCVFLSVVASLLPRFTIKAVQKLFFPYDIDVIREQVVRGDFDHLRDLEPTRLDFKDRKVDTSNGGTSFGSDSSVSANGETIISTGKSQ